MYNALHEISGVEKLVQVGVRDFSESEWEYVRKVILPKLLPILIKTFEAGNLKERHGKILQKK